MADANDIATGSGQSADHSRAGDHGFLRRVAYWCVPTSALRWGQLTVTRVRFSGVVKPHVGTIFTLPSGYRPNPDTLRHMAQAIDPDLSRGYVPDEDA